MIAALRALWRDLHRPAPNVRIHASPAAYLAARFPYRFGGAE